MAGMRIIPSVHRHTQAIAASDWNVQHNLGGSGSQGVPVVDVIITDPEDGVKKKIIPMEVTIVDANNLVISFSTDLVGEAVIAG